MSQVKVLAKPMRLFKQFRVAVTWQDVEHAFRDLSGKSQTQDFAIYRHDWHVGVFFFS